MDTEYGRGSLGDIGVNNNVIKNIALRAASEIPGIHTLKKGYLQKIWGTLTKKDTARGVRLQFLSEAELDIALRLVVEYGVNIPEAVEEAQENVKKAIEHMTGLTIREISVKIVGMCPGEGVPAYEDIEEAPAGEEELSLKDEEEK